MRTEKLITRLRLWNLRFDAKCEDIIRRVSTSARTERRSQNEEGLSEVGYASSNDRTNSTDSLTSDDSWGEEAFATVTDESESEEESEEATSNAESSAEVDSIPKISTKNRVHELEDEQQKGTYQGSDPTSENRVPEANLEESSATADTRRKSEGWGSSLGSWGASWSTDVKKEEDAKKAEADGGGVTIDDWWYSSMPFTMKKKKSTQKKLDYSSEITPSETTVSGKEVNTMNETDPWDDWGLSAHVKKKGKKNKKINEHYVEWQMWKPTIEKTYRIDTENTPKPYITPRSESEPKNRYPLIQSRATSPEPATISPETEHASTTSPQDRTTKNDQTRSLTRRIPRTEALRPVYLTMKFLGKMQLESLPEMREEEWDVNSSERICNCSSQPM
jgi:hypothetical protein